MERHAATRWIVVLARRFRPQLRFLWDRVTPGGTFGLEFTSLMAVLAVALFVLVAYTVDRRRRTGPDAGRHDRDRIRRTASARGWLTDVAKVVTALGSGGVRLALAAVCAALLAARRRWAEFGCWSPG